MNTFFKYAGSLFLNFWCHTEVIGRWWWWRWRVSCGHIVLRVCHWMAKRLHYHSNLYFYLMLCLHLEVFHSCEQIKITQRLSWTTTSNSDSSSLSISTLMYSNNFSCPVVLYFVGTHHCVPNGISQTEIGVLQKISLKPGVVQFIRIFGKRGWLGK